MLSFRLFSLRLDRTTSRRYARVTCIAISMASAHLTTVSANAYATSAILARIVTLAGKTCQTYRKSHRT